MTLERLNEQIITSLKEEVERLNKTLAASVKAGMCWIQERDAAVVLLEKWLMWYDLREVGDIHDLVQMHIEVTAKTATFLKEMDDAS